MATLLEGLFEQLTKVRAQNLPTRSEVTTAENGHMWLGKKGDGTGWSLKKTTDDSYEVTL